MKLFLELLREEKAATAIEYGLIVAIISVAAIISTKMAGDQLVTSFSKISSTLSSSNTSR